MEVLLNVLKVGLIRDPLNFDEMLNKLVSKGLWIQETLVQEAKIGLEKLAELRHKFGCLL